MCVYIWVDPFHDLLKWIRTLTQNQNEEHTLIDHIPQHVGK